MRCGGVLRNACVWCVSSKHRVFSIPGGKLLMSSGRIINDRIPARDVWNGTLPKVQGLCNITIKIQTSSQSREPTNE